MFRRSVEGKPETPVRRISKEDISKPTQVEHLLYAPSGKNLFPLLCSFEVGAPTPTPAPAPVPAQHLPVQSAPAPKLKKTFSLTSLLKGFKGEEHVDAAKHRAPLGSLVSQPSGFVHVAHIGLDKDTLTQRIAFEGTENESQA
jgi:hypothetical protein